MKKELDREEAAWEAVLAAAWKESEGADAAAWAEEPAATARKVDAALRTEREARRRRARAWRGWGAAAACAAAAGLAAVFGGGGRGGETTVAAVEETAAEEEETTLAEAREAPVAEAFAGLEEMWNELASLELGYDWDDEDWEVAN